MCVCVCEKERERECVCVCVNACHTLGSSSLAGVALHGPLCRLCVRLNLTGVVDSNGGLHSSTFDR